MVTESILSKIKALLNMTVEKGCTTEEASTAMEKVQTLLLQHNLSIRDINTGEQKDEQVGKIGMVTKQADRYLWKIALLNVISKNMMCSVIRNSHKREVYLFGTRENVSIVSEMHEWIAIQLEQMSLKDFNVYKRQGGYVNGKSWKTSYFNAAISEINKRLSKPYENFSQTTGCAVVLYNDKALSEAVKRVFPKVNKGYSYRGTDAGRSFGRLAGQNASLTPQRKLGNDRLYLSS